MNIVLLSHTFLPTVGGRELVVHHLAQAFTKAGHTARVVSPGGWRVNRSLGMGYPVHRFPNISRGRYGTGPRALARELEAAVYLTTDILSHGCDIIHAHTSYPAGYVANLVRRLLRVPLVVTPHGVDVHTIPALGHGMRLDPVLREKVHRALLSADAVTAISENVVQAVREIGVPEERIHRIQNGVDISRFQCGESRTILRQRLSIGANDRVIISVGNWHPRKGQELLLKCFASVKRTLPDAKLILVGRGTDKLGDLAEELRIRDHVYLLGALPYPAPGSRQEDLLGQAYAAADVFVSAGMHAAAEGLSLALLEAMAARLPVVATDISGNRDVIENGSNGYLAPPGDADALTSGILMALESGAKLGEGAGRRVESMSWDTVAGYYLTLYEGILGSSDSGMKRTA